MIVSQAVTNSLFAQLLSGSPYCGLRLFFGQGILPIITIKIEHLIYSDGMTFNIFSYDAVWAENRTDHHLNKQRTNVFLFLKFAFLTIFWHIYFLP